MESDNFLNGDGSITVVRQAIINNRVVNRNSLWTLSSEGLGNESLVLESSEDLGRHCCLADAKKIKKTFVYSKLVKKESGKADWEIFRLNSHKEEINISMSTNVDQWPMYNKKSDKLLWVSWNNKEKIWSIKTKKLSESKINQIDLIKSGLELEINGGKKVIFSNVN